MYGNIVGVIVSHFVYLFNKNDVFICNYLLEKNLSFFLKLIDWLCILRGIFLWNLFFFVAIFNFLFKKKILIN